MAIHMEKDPNQDRNQDQNNPPRRRTTTDKSGGGMLSFLPIILGFLFKNPKLLVPAVVIGGLFYMMGGMSLFDESAVISDNTNPNNQNFTGAPYEEKEYDKAQVYEPLANNAKNPLPEKVSLLKYAPKRLNQGRQGSCVGWASAYAARTILHAQETGANPNQVAFSPSYLYNQISLTGCQGAYLQTAMQAMKKNGGLPMGNFGYDERSCSKKPNSRELTTGKQFRILGAERLSKDHNKYAVNSLAVKQNLSQGGPVVIGMQVGGTFMGQMRGKDTWIPTQRDYNLQGFSGHAMCVIGYDDYKNGGSFQIMNSWGPEWGNNGVAWVRYKDFDYFTKEAYGLYPMGNADDVESNQLGVRFGLVNNETKAFMELKQIGERSFRTLRPITTSDRFKVELTNTVACYTYLFSMQSDGSSKVLFPYTPKHSPYCGITGTRQFPKDYSMRADNVGNRDYIAVVVTKEPVDYNVINDRLNAASGASYKEKLKQALGNAEVENVEFKTGKTIDFLANTADKLAVGIIIEIDK